MIIFRFSRSTTAATLTTLLTAAIGVNMPLTAQAQQYGSHANQTVLKTSIPRGLFTVYINGKKVGDYTGVSATTLDVGNYVKGGANTLKITRKPDDEGKKPLGMFSISYAAEKNKFRQITTTTINASKAGSNAVTFNLPKEAAPKP